MTKPGPRLVDIVSGISTAFLQKGYLVDDSPRIPGVSALLFARSPNRFQLGFARVEDHFVFVEGTADPKDCLEHLKEVYQKFSANVNQAFRVPRPWRITIPNLAVVAISEKAFPEEVRSFARTIDLNPWIGGEVGQLILVEVAEKRVISLVSLSSGRYPRPGALPLGHAASLIRQVCDLVLASQEGVFDSAG